MSSSTVSPGIFLPNGNFIQNNGDGHSKNAHRICSKYPEIFCLMNLSSETPDDFIIQCGFAILASYNGSWCFKVAKDNPFTKIQNLTFEYEEKGVEIWKYWNINQEYSNKIREISNLVYQKTPSLERDQQNPNLNRKVGFILHKFWYPNMGCGHEKNARTIILNHNWQTEWLSTNATAQDFIVLYKGAIQVGSGVLNRIIIADSKFYTQKDLEMIMSRYQLEISKYKIVFY